LVLIHELGRSTARVWGDRRDFYTFSALMEGTPPFEVDMARLPREIVAKTRGG